MSWGRNNEIDTGAATEAAEKEIVRMIEAGGAQRKAAEAILRFNKRWFFIAGYRNLGKMELALAKRNGINEETLRAIPKIGE